MQTIGVGIFDGNCSKLYWSIIFVNFYRILFDGLLNKTTAPKRSHYNDGNGCGKRKCKHVTASV